MLVKETRKLFQGIYQYKVVLICPGASLMRGGTYDNAIETLEDPNFLKTSTGMRRIKNFEDLEYCISVAKLLKNMTDCIIRVEAPLISVYTNTEANINKLTSIDEDRIKYISKPPNGQLEKNVIIMPKIDFEFRITLGHTKQEHSAFIAWADSNNKIKLTKSARRDLSKSRSWGGTHFYVTGEKNITFVKMHLGDSVNKIEKIVKNI